MQFKIYAGLFSFQVYTAKLDPKETTSVRGSNLSSKLSLHSYVG